MSQRKSETREEYLARCREYRDSPERKEASRKNRAERNAIPEVRKAKRESDARRRAIPEVREARRKSDAKRRTTPEYKNYAKKYYATRHAENYVSTGDAGRKPDAPNVVYVVTNVDLGAAKVGSGTLGRANGYKGWELAYISEVMPKSEALKIESSVLETLPKGGYLTKDLMPTDGYTETFGISELDAVLLFLEGKLGASDVDVELVMEKVVTHG